MAELNILLIDDEPAQLTSIQSFLKRRNYTVYTAESGSEGMAVLQGKNVDLVFTDFRMPDMNGLEVVKSVKAFHPGIAVVVMTAFSDTEDAVRVIKEGAYDYLSKPVNLDELEILVQKVRDHRTLVSENSLLKEQLQEKHHFNTIISKSNAMETVMNTAGRVAKSKATVLIRGESGTGKELIARAIHDSSDRKDRPLITVNCAALPEGLLESELFGHEKGSFTGAASRRIGRFEQADGGTLFIDEIGDIGQQTQVKLLRALQFGEFERVGGSETIKTNVRVITATNRNLETLIQQSQFREDLYYRINVVTITLPPLRERKTDIPILSRHFIEKYSQENHKKITELSKEAEDTLMRYHFPGNVRELENLIERAVVLARQEIITVDDLPPNLEMKSGSEIFDPYNLSKPYKDKVSAFEKTMIEKALEMKHGNQSRAAELLGISERHLRSRMQKLNIINNMRG